MNTRQLETFLSVCETLNLTETARRLNFAQSSITSQIKKLEDEIGYCLFERLGKGVVLTTRGVHFKENAVQLLALMKDSKEIGETKTAIVIGATESQCAYRIPKLLAEYNRLYPNIDISFRPANSNYEVQKEIFNGNLDIGFVTDFDADFSKLVAHKLAEDRVLLLCSPQCSLSQKDNVSLDDLQDVTFLLTEEGSCYRSIFENLLYKNGVFPSNIIEFASIEAIKECVKLNIGVTVLLELAVTSSIANGELISLDFGHDLPVACTYLVHHKDKQLSEYLLDFIALSEKVFGLS